MQHFIPKLNRKWHPITDKTDHAPAQHHTTVDCSKEKMENIDRVKLSKNEARLEQMRECMVGVWGGWMTARLWSLNQPVMALHVMMQLDHLQTRINISHYRHNHISLSAAGTPRHPGRERQDHWIQENPWYLIQVDRIVLKIECRLSTETVCGVVTGVNWD